MNFLKTGTTTVGIKGKNFVVLAADTQATLGNLAVDKTAVKLHKITNNIVLAISGSVGDALYLVRLLRANAKYYKLTRRKEIPVRGMTVLTANILNGSRFYPYQVLFILGGYDTEPRLYSTDMIGGYGEVKDYTAFGSGMSLALSVLESGYKEGMKAEEAVHLAKKAVESSAKRDVYSGGYRIKAYLITKEGIKEYEWERESA